LAAACRKAGESAPGLMRVASSSLPCGNPALPQVSGGCHNRADPCRTRGLREPEPVSGHPAVRGPTFRLAPAAGGAYRGWGENRRSPMPRRTPQRPPRRRAVAMGAGGGTPADRLIRTWLDEYHDAFEDLAEGLIAGGRDGVLAAAMRKLSERYEDEAVEEFADALAGLAEAAEGQDAFHFAELVLLPILTEGPPPDPAPLASGLGSSGAFPPEAEAAFAEGWRSVEAVRSLSPCALRRVLLDLAGGRPPADLPPLPPGGMAEGAGLTHEIAVVDQPASKAAFWLRDEWWVECLIATHGFDVLRATQPQVLSCKPWLLASQRLRPPVHEQCFMR
jgi:hypothetical protein